MKDRLPISENPGFYKGIEAACVILALTGLSGLVLRNDLNRPVPFSQVDTSQQPVPIVKEYDPSVRGRLSEYPTRFRESLQPITGQDEEIDFPAIGFGLLLITSLAGGMAAEEKRKDLS